MNNRLHDAFDEIKAEERLKQDTIRFIRQYKMQTKTAYPMRRWVIAAACLFLIAVTGVNSYSLYFTPSAYLDVDVNPSIELTINRVNRIINAYAYNEDGNSLLANVDVTHKSYEQALLLLIAEMEAKGYLADDNLLSVTVQSKDNDEDLLLSIQGSLSDALTQHHGGLEQDYFTVDAETKAHAHDADMSPAKYLAVLSLQEVDPTATIEECRHHSISELRQYTQEHGGNHHGNSENGNSQDNKASEDAEESISQKGHHKHRTGHE